MECERGRIRTGTWSVVSKHPPGPWPFAAGPRTLQCSSAVDAKGFINLPQKRLHSWHAGSNNPKVDFDRSPKTQDIPGSLYRSEYQPEFAYEECLGSSELQNSHSMSEPAFDAATRYTMRTMLLAVAQLPSKKKTAVRAISFGRAS